MDSIHDGYLPKHTVSMRMTHSHVQSSQVCIERDKDCLHWHDRFELLFLGNQHVKLNILVVS